ncbi:hypothetical protein DSO57_1031818 [Entomophthora muscae]|uniref:Uncharacterized protein n=1 Tax=Entomophthora muscae TaxID=34485 RepID=A0ACC2UAC9_9FUNG|nr:hypothetical protein DSO57_1031818 [Entomophthora muscae]
MAYPHAMSTDFISLSKIAAASRNHLHFGVEKLGLKKTHAAERAHVQEFTYNDSFPPLERQLYPLGERATDSQYYPHVVHRFGRHSFLGVRSDILHFVSQIKTSLKKYRHLLTAALNNPDTATVNQAFSKINLADSLVILEEEAKRAQRQNNMNFRISQARRRIAYHLDPSRSPAAFYTVTLKTMARELKLDHFTDDHDTFVTMTICGKLIVIDIDISNAGDILKVKVNHPNDDNFSEKIDKMILDDLKSYNMVAVYSNIAALAALDIQSSVNSKIDFLHVFRALGHDLDFIYQMELKSLGDDLRAHMHAGIGFPLTHYKHWGPSLICWSPPNPEFPPPASELHSWLATHDLPKGTQQAYFGLDLVTASHPFLPPHIKGYYHPESWTLDPSDQMLFNCTEVSFQPPSTEKCIVLTHATPSLVAPLQWAFILDPPLLAFQTIANQLSGLPFTPASHIKDMPLFRDLMLLSTFSEDNINIDPNTVYFDPDSYWVASLKSCPISQRYHMLKDYNPAPCLTVHRIPFLHPQELSNIIQIIRQQNTFNALYNSCFNPETLLDSEVASKLTSVDIEFSFTCQPMGISVRFPCPKECVTLTFFPQLKGPPVTIEFDPASEFMHLSESVQHLVTNSLSIPLAVGFILKRFAPAM